MERCQGCGRRQVLSGGGCGGISGLSAAIYAEGPVKIVGNLGKVKGYGAESTLNHAFNKNWTVGPGVSWFDSDPTGVQPLCDGTEASEGATLPWQPEWTDYLLGNNNYLVSSGGAIVGNFRWSVESERRTGWESLADGSISIDSYEEAQLTVGF